MGAAISYKYTNTWHTMQNYRVMTVNIDEGNNDDPVACCTYADDAVDMPVGFSGDAITAWQEFFKYRPCILCGNEVMEYLDPDNYNLRDDGTPSLLSGRTHNTVNGRLGVETYEEHWLWNTEKQKIMRIMIEWPRLGIKITKQDNIVSISMTDRPNAPGYSYQAYYLNGVSYDHLYIETNFCHINNDGDFPAETDPLYFADPTETPASEWLRLSEVATTKATLLNNIRGTEVGTANYHLTNYHQLNIIQCAYVLHSKSIGKPKVAGVPANSMLRTPSLTNGRFGYYRTDLYYGDNFYTMLFGLYNLYHYSQEYSDKHFMVYDGICCTDVGEFFIMHDGAETTRWGDVSGYQKVTATGDVSDHYAGGAPVKSIIGGTGTFLVNSTYDGYGDSHYWGWYHMLPPNRQSTPTSNPELDGTDDVVVCGQYMTTDGANQMGGIFSISSSEYNWPDQMWFRVSVLL